MKEVPGFVVVVVVFLIAECVLSTGRVFRKSSHEVNSYYQDVVILEVVSSNQDGLGSSQMMS